MNLDKKIEKSKKDNLSENNKVVYVEYLEEITNEPNYEKY